MLKNKLVIYTCVSCTTFATKLWRLGITMPIPCWRGTLIYQNILLVCKWRPITTSVMRIRVLSSCRSKMRHRAQNAKKLLLLLFFPPLCYAEISRGKLPFMLFVLRKQFGPTSPLPTICLHSTPSTGKWDALRGAWTTIYVINW